MSRLTRVPLGLIEPGSGQMNDSVKFNGEELELQDNSQDNQNKDIVAAQFDGETGTLTLQRSDSSTLMINGFLTRSGMGVGPTGPTGPQGKPGSNGRNGKDGRVGDQGCQGPKGDFGPQGATGPAGPIGSIGPQGATGPTGPTGPKGEAGQDGKQPVFGAGEVDGYELFAKSTLKCWGRFTSTQEAAFQRVIFPESFTTDQHRAMFLQFVDPSSNIAGAVSIDKINRGNAELRVIDAKLPQEADGAGGTRPVAKTGWDFYWFVIGSDADA